MLITFSGITSVSVKNNPLNNISTDNYSNERGINAVKPNKKKNDAVVVAISSFIITSFLVLF